MFLSPLPFQHSASKDESSPALGQTTYNEKNMNERNFFPASICFQVTAADNLFLFIHGGLLHDFFKMFLRLEQFLTLILTINTLCACALQRACHWRAGLTLVFFKHCQLSCGNKPPVQNHRLRKWSLGKGHVRCDSGGVF